MASVIDSVVNPGQATWPGLPVRRDLLAAPSRMWDYGPLGVELRRTSNGRWWKSVVTGRDDVVGLDSSVILPREVWVASGHVETFNDPLVERQSRKRHRRNPLRRRPTWRRGAEGGPRIRSRCRWPPSPADCGPGPVDRAARDFNMMLKDVLGPIEDRGGSASSAPGDGPLGHLRQLGNVSHHVAQEAAVRHQPDRQELPQRDHPATIFRTRELSRWRWSSSSNPAPTRSGIQYWIDRRADSTWAGISRENLRHYEHPKEKLSHYPIAPSTSSTGSAWAATAGASSGRCQPHRLRPQGAFAAFGHRPVVYDQASIPRYLPVT